MRARGFRLCRGKERPLSRLMRFGLWLAAIALLSQSLAVAAPLMPMGGPAQAAAAELRALLGPSVVVCAQDDGSAPQTPHHSAHDDCPLCRIAAGAGLLDLPSAAPFTSPVFVKQGEIQRTTASFVLVPVRFSLFLARAPPSLT